MVNSIADGGQAAASGSRIAARRSGGPGAVPARVPFEPVQLLAYGWARVVNDERGAAETSTIFAWIVVGVLVVMGLLGALQALGADVITWIRTQLGV